MTPQSYPSATVAELLKETLDPSHLLGSGTTANTYRFPEGNGLDDYVLRVRNRYDSRLFREVLGRSTSLTPAEHLVGQERFGQPLMELSGISPAPAQILLKERGKSIESLVRAEEPGAHARLADLTSKVLRSGSRKNPFVDVLTKAQQSCVLGLNANCTAGNVLFEAETGRLTLVDQHGMATRPVPFAKVVKDLERTFWLPALRKEMMDDRKKIIGLIREAAQLVARDAQPQTGFATVHDVSAVALDSAPYMLAEQLKSIEAQAQIPGR